MDNIRSVIRAAVFLCPFRSGYFLSEFYQVTIIIIDPEFPHAVIKVLHRKADFSFIFYLLPQFIDPFEMDIDRACENRFIKRTAVVVGERCLRMHELHRYMIFSDRSELLLFINGSTGKIQHRHIKVHRFLQRRCGQCGDGRQQFHTRKMLG